MKTKTYDFNKYDKLYVADGNGGFDTVDKTKLTTMDNEVLVVLQNGTCHIEWEFDGTAYSEFYVKDEFGNIVKLDFDEEQTVSCCVCNPKTHDGKSFCVEYENDVLTSTNEISCIVDEKGALTSKKITVPPGRYHRERGFNCGGSFKIIEMEVYNNEAHAAWYGEPKIDGVKETARAYLVKIPDSVLNSLTTRFIELKTFADAHNIELIADEYSGEIRAVMVPKGYNVECDERSYKDMIPWELMPVIGRCSFTMNEDCEYQPTLKEIVKEADNG